MRRYTHTHTQIKNSEKKEEKYGEMETQQHDQLIRDCYLHEAASYIPVAHLRANLLSACSIKTTPHINHLTVAILFGSVKKNLPEMLRFIA